MFHKSTVLLFCLTLLAGCQTTKTSNTASTKAVKRNIEDTKDEQEKELTPQEIALQLVFDLAKSEEPEYGKSPENPIYCGGMQTIGRFREYEMMSRLQTEDNEAVLSKYLGYFYKNPGDKEYIDVWQVIHKDGSSPTTLYLNAFSEDSPKVPTGFNYLTGANPTGRSTLYPSANDAPLDEIHNIDTSDGISYEESITIAQCYIIHNGLSVDFDVNSVQYEEGSNSDTHIISFYKNNPSYGGTTISDDSLGGKIYKTLFNAPKLTVFVKSSKEVLVWSLLDVYNNKNFTPKNTE